MFYIWKPVLSQEYLLCYYRPFQKILSIHLFSCSLFGEYAFPFIISYSTFIHRFVPPQLPWKNLPDIAWSILAFACFLTCFKNISPDMLLWVPCLSLFNGILSFHNCRFKIGYAMLSAILALICNQLFIGSGQIGI